MTENNRQIEHPRPPEPRHAFRWDLTINIPTVVTLVTLTAGIIGFGVNKYTELTNADASNSYAISNLRIEVEKISASQSGVVREMREGLDTMRKENREDFKEVRGSLDRINDRLSPSTNSSMKGWQK